MLSGGIFLSWALEVLLEAQIPAKPTITIIEYLGVPQCPGLWREEDKAYHPSSEIFISMLVMEKVWPSVTVCVPPSGLSLLEGAEAEQRPAPMGRACHSAAQSPRSLRLPDTRVSSVEFKGRT